MRRLARTWLALSLLLGAGCSYPHLYEDGKIDEDYFARVEVQTSRARGLPFTNRVPHEVITTEQARAKIAADVKRDSVESDAKSTLRAWQALGFAPNGPLGDDLDKDLIDLTAEQAAAFYDPREKKFYVSGVTDKAKGVATGFASWMLDRDLVAEIVFSHELVHALQDQKYDLEKWMKPADGNDDAELARRAVVEGDATLFGFKALSLSGTGDIEMKRKDLEDGASGDAFERVPKILSEDMFFAYWAGYAFLKHLNYGFVTPPKEVDPWLRPPSSSSEILHPEKYVASQGKVDGTNPALPKLSPKLPDGLKLVRENTVGEFGICVLLEGAKESKPEAERASKGWVGDRYRVFELASDSSKLALAWSLAFETPEDAQAFVRAYKLFVPSKHVGDASVCTLAGERGAVVVEAPDGVLASALLEVVRAAPAK